ncbi:MAG: cytochrome c oxidase subunit 3, partial [Hyphomicrobiales bacterium]|nr:cytochrome c oxidase subunit 3 [Hyphomicrobiales bacterium]
AWYWHFVDVVWLFLFTFVYVWASWGAVVAH